MLKSILNLDSQTITFSHCSDVLEGYFKTKVISELEHIKRANSEKLVSYNTICHDFSLKNYLSFDSPKRIKCLLTRIRISAQSLATETRRYSHSRHNLRNEYIDSAPIMWKARNILECSRYSSLRDKYLTGSLTHEILDIEDIVNPKTHRQASMTCCYIKEDPLLRDNQDLIN